MNKLFIKIFLDQPVGDWKFFDDDKIDFIGLSRFEEIMILIDKDTSYAAEWLVYKVAKSGIVNLVGRPTSGNLAFLILLMKLLINDLYSVFQLKI